MISESSIRRWVCEDAFGALPRALFAVCAATVMAIAISSGAAAESAAPSTPNLGRLGVHVVNHGENLFTIARRYRMRVGDLARLNGMPTDAYVLAGRPLWVPLASAVNARADSPAEPADGSVAASDNGGDDSGAASEGDVATYLVAPGDTLFSLSQRFGVAMDDLKRWNGLPIDGSLRAGETLVLHGAAARGFGTDEASGQEPGDAPASDGSSTRAAYVVQSGDTLTSIAARFGTTAAGLRSANGLVGDHIHEGQTLLVPRQGSGVAPVGGAKRIEVDVSEQRMYVWQGDQLVWNFTTSTGMAGYPTRRGAFAVQSKIPNAWSSAWQLWMPNWLGIYWAGASENGIHALPIINGQRLWAGYLGTPISYGCVVLGIDEAELLYNWADIGTPVVIHD